MTNGFTMGWQCPTFFFLVKTAAVRKPVYCCRYMDGGKHFPGGKQAFSW